MVRYKIGEIARLLGLTTQAIRFYEEEGVITPMRSENGTRYYNEGHVVQLLSFRKYRQSSFGVQQIVEHFRGGALPLLAERLGEQTDRLDAQARFLSRKAEDMRAYAALLRDTHAHMGRVRAMERPAGYLLDVPFDALRHADARRLAALGAYADAMPATCIAFTRRAGAQGDAVLRMFAAEHAARRWALPTDMALRVPARRWAVYCGRLGKLPWEEAGVDASLEAVRAAGFPVGGDGEVMGMHVASETDGGRVSLCARVYVPLD